MSQSILITEAQDANYLLDTELKYECDLRGLAVQPHDEQTIDLLNQHMQNEKEPWKIPYQVNTHGQRLDYGVCKGKIEEFSRRLKSNLAKATKTDAQRLLHCFYRLSRLSKSYTKAEERAEYTQLVNTVQNLYSSVKEVCREREISGNTPNPLQRSPIPEDVRLSENLAHSTELGHRLDTTIDITEEDEATVQSQNEPTLSQTQSEFTTGNLTSDVDHLALSNAPVTEELHQFVQNVNQNANLRPPAEHIQQTHPQQINNNNNSNHNQNPSVSVSRYTNLIPPLNASNPPTIPTSALTNTVSSSNHEQPIISSTATTSIPSSNTINGTKPKKTKTISIFVSRDSRSTKRCFVCTICQS